MRKKVVSLQKNAHRAGDWVAIKEAPEGIYTQSHSPIGTQVNKDCWSVIWSWHLYDGDEILHVKRSGKVFLEEKEACLLHAQLSMGVIPDETGQE